MRGLYASGAVEIMRMVARSREFDGIAATKPRLKRRNVPRFAVLCYHRVGTDGVPLYSQLPAEIFEAQMQYLRKNYRIVSLDQMIDEMDEPRSLDPAVALTFDDGYRGLYTEAFPILKAYGVPASIFLTIGCIESGQVAWYDRIFLSLNVAPSDAFEINLDRPRRFLLASPASRLWAAAEIISFLRACTPSRRKECCADLENKIQLPEGQLRDRMLTWEQIHIMHRAGINFGTHTMSHPVVSRLSIPELEWELRESKRILEQRLEAPVRHFAFPFGKSEECSDAAVSLLAQDGYRSAATTEWGLNSPGDDAFRLRRIQIGEAGSLGRFAFEINRLFLFADSRPATGREVNSSASPSSIPKQDMTGSFHA